MQVEEAVEETHVQRFHRIGGKQPQRSGMHKLEIFDDDAGLDDIARAVHQQREFAQRPALEPVRRMLRRIRPDAA